MRALLVHHGRRSILTQIDRWYKTDQLTDFLETVRQRRQFNQWFFGHYHQNRVIDQRFILQWEQISKLEIETS